MASVELIVYGKPITQGDKQQGVTRAGRHYIREDNANALRKWRQTIKDAPTLRTGPDDPLDGPLAAHIVFTIAHTIASARATERGHRPRPAVAPDIDKMLRAVFDALGPKWANLIADDSRVVEFDRLSKVYPGTDPDALTQTGVLIRIRTLTPDQEAIPLIPGDIHLTTINDPGYAPRIQIDRADYRVWIAAGLLDKIRAGDHHPDVTLDGDRLTINGTTRSVTYRIGPPADDPTGGYVTATRL